MHRCFSLFFIELLIGVLCACCQPRRSAMSSVQTDLFKLSASPGTVDGYPSTIDEGRFITPGGGSFPVPYGHFLKSGWGGTAIGWAVGEELQPAPDSLEIRWFSYTEDKFYQGKFLLPQQRLHALLTQGFWNPELKQKETYDDLAVAVGPTGAVYVWLRGGGSNCVFIGRYQAQEIAYDYERHRPRVDRAADVRETRAALTPEVQHEIATGTVSAKRWDSYLKTYPWQLAFSRPLTLTDFSFSYLNAEESGFPLTADLVAHAKTVLEPRPKPVPTSCMLYVAGPYGRKKLFKVDPFEEHETMAAFQTLHRQHPTEAIILWLDTDERLTKATLSLRAGGQTISLPKARVQAFDLD